MFDRWSANLEKSLCSFVDPAGGTTTLDEDYQPVYVPAEPIEIIGVKLDLSLTEKAARQQLQEDSNYKIVLKDTATARTIKRTFTVTIDSINYEIVGQPKTPRLPNSLITVYIKE